MALSDLGWDDVFADAFAAHEREGLRPARVICELKHAYAVATGDDEVLAECRGRLLHEAGSRSDLPAVGDWVAIRPRSGESRKFDILAVLPRKTKFSRRAAGEHGHEQVVAANADALFILVGLEREPNLRKIERFLAVARQSGAEPVVILNKRDLHPNPEAAVAAVDAVAAGASVLALSATEGTGCRSLSPWLKRGRTIALLGPSGAGKSTLVNRLMHEEVQVVRDVRESDSKGRHTTTRRELFSTPTGVLIIDTPGLRELQIWHAEIDDTFPDIADLAVRCRFSNCQHESEPGCAIRAAIESGTLPVARWQSFLKLESERAIMRAHLAARADRRPRIVWKKASEGPRPRFSTNADHD